MLALETLIIIRKVTNLNNLRILVSGGSLSWVFVLTYKEVVEVGPRVGFCFGMKSMGARAWQL